MLSHSTVGATASAYDGHQRRAKIAVGFWFLLFYFICSHPNGFFTAWGRYFTLPSFLVLSILPVVAASEWYLAVFAVSTELGAVKEGVRGIQCSLRAAIRATRSGVSQGGRPRQRRKKSRGRKMKYH